VIERSDGYTAIEDVGKYFQPASRWLACEREIARHARGRVLDVGAGAGRVALHLQERRHDVVAIDTSEGAIEVSSDRGVRDARLRSVSSLRAADGPFDTYVLFGNNLGLLRDRRHAPWLLRRFRATGGPAVRILGVTRDPYRTEDPAHLRYHAANRAQGRMGGQGRLRLRYLDHRSAWFDYLFLSLPELEEVAADGGWRVAEVADDGGPVYAVMLAPAT